MMNKIIVRSTLTYICIFESAKALELYSTLCNLGARVARDTGGKPSYVIWGLELLEILVVNLVCKYKLEKVP